MSRRALLQKRLIFHWVLLQKSPALSFVDTAIVQGQVTFACVYRMTFACVYRMTFACVYRMTCACVYRMASLLCLLSLSQQSPAKLGLFCERALQNIGLFCKRALHVCVYRMASLFCETSTPK